MVVSTLQVMLYLVCVIYFAAKLWNTNQNEDLLVEGLHRHRMMGQI